MKISQLGLTLIGFFEDYRSVAYPDQGGVWTCGFGHTGPDVARGTTCTLEQAYVWLAADVVEAEEAVMHLVTQSLTQHQFDALVSFTYNDGIHAFDTSALRQYVLASRMPEAAGEFLRWVHVKGVVSTGLVRRRKVEQALFLDGVV